MAPFYVLQKMINLLRSQEKGNCFLFPSHVQVLSTCVIPSSFLQIFLVLKRNCKINYCLTKCLSQAICQDLKRDEKFPPESYTTMLRTQVLNRNVSLRNEAKTSLLEVEDELMYFSIPFLSETKEMFFETMTVKNKMSKAQHTYEKHIILYIVPQRQVN